jgi:glucosamine--fructose-6-phosphate aminotransferase (isomerizing)
MCGIIAYVGPRDAAPVLLDGLARLEYRGYDSAGVSIQQSGRIETRKLAGRVEGLRGLVGREPVSGSCGIAHTRWATHGAPTSMNAHPHADCDGGVALVHNGIIENADALRTWLQAAGHLFNSETDTEVLAHLIEEAPEGTLESKVAWTLRQVEGTYGIAAISAADDGKIVAARKGSPVLLGIGDGEFFIASDASALLGHTRSVVYLDDGDIATITTDGYQVMDSDDRDAGRPVDEIEWDIDAAERGGDAHFMLKEIHEQPTTIENVMRGRLPRTDSTPYAGGPELRSSATPRLNGLNLSVEDCLAIRRIQILGCGSSWHAGLVARHYFEQLANVPVDVEYASEFRYRDLPSVSGTLTIVISQSGETADTIEAMRKARSGGACVVGIVNVVGSTIAREADGGIYLHAGPEIGVASTKAFTSQLVALLMFALYVGRRRGVGEAEGERVINLLHTLPDLVRRTLALEPEIAQIADAYKDSTNALFLGRGMQFPVALEGALKLKEISYIHAEGYPAAEMKHGPIALVDEKMPVVFIAPKDAVYQKSLSSMHEVRARGGRIIALTSEGNGDLSALAEHQLRIPDCDPLLLPIVASVPLQLFAYYVAVGRGCDVDRPRNLAKSVTVE